MKTVAIIQARLKSTRLPGKVLADLHGRSLLSHVVERALAINGVDEVVLNVPEADYEAIMAGLLPALPRDLHDQVTRVRRFLACAVAGQEQDVLGSYAKIATDRQADVVMRLTGDCPLLDPVLCQLVLQLYLALDYTAPHRTGFYYCANDTARSGFPDGTDCEVVSAASLRAADQYAYTAYDREHVMPWLRTYGHNYGILAQWGTDLSRRKWSVDTEADLLRARVIMARVKGFGWKDTLEAEEASGWTR